ncbi:hypothetical protein NECAME_10136 [Necator americanus]|uniref:Uncharacterized protein n=1 Tax=Necator americanus TaxID=51031 RepID=W2TCT4_NECAM|nr:hypothetical protein NECAME_10136 [Necator americanus]ETN78802.1 hypothetical protein NECAME_10136 [Necator americanus]
MVPGVFPTIARTVVKKHAMDIFDKRLNKESETRNISEKYFCLISILDFVVEPPSFLIAKDYRTGIVQ